MTLDKVSHQSVSLTSDSAMMSSSPKETTTMTTTMNKEFSDYCASQDARNTNQLNVTKYSLMLCDALQQNYQKLHPNGQNYSYALISGRKYHKVMQCINGETESVHCFIDRKSGEVYKAASIKAPAKGVRFNLLIIQEREFVLENCDWSGGYLYRNAYYAG